MNSTAQSKRIDRREFVSTLLSQTPESLVVTGLGSAAYDVFASGDRHGDHRRDGCRLDGRSLRPA